MTEASVSPDASPGMDCYMLADLDVDRVDQGRGR